MSPMQILPHCETTREHLLCIVDLVCNQDAAAIPLIDALCDQHRVFVRERVQAWNKEAKQPQNLWYNYQKQHWIEGNA